MTTINALPNYLRLAACVTSICFSMVARKRPALFAFMFIALCAAMTGCSEKGPVSPPTAGNGRTGVGSTFIYKVTKQLESPTPDVSYDTLVVSRVGLRVAGKNNVMELLRRNIEFNDTTYTYYAFESNGDISQAIFHEKLNTGDSALWLTYPIASRTATTLSIDDNGPYADYKRYLFTQSYVGTEQIAVNGKQIESQKIIQKTTYFSKEGNSIEADSPIWWGTSIGCVTKSESLDNHGERKELVNYTLK